MTHAGGAILLSDVAGGSRTTLPPDGGATTEQRLAVERSVVEVGARRWAATPRPVPRDDADVTDGGGALEVAYEVLG